MKKTVFVIGAGASYEADLPVGDGLKELIRTMLAIQHEGNHGPTTKQLITALKVHSIQKGSDFQRLVRTAQKMSRGIVHANSIDTFIDMHRGDQDIELCGKLAIAISILTAERQSKFGVSMKRSVARRSVDRSVSTDFDAIDLRDTWYVKLARLLFDGCSRGELKQRLSSVAFIVFNYDRCLEHFLVNSLTDAYDLDADAATELVNGIEIHHPYGTTGVLRWMGGKVVTPFAAEVSEVGIVEIAQDIRTFSEAAFMSPDQLRAIRSLMRDAGMVVYLGFSFLPLNLDLLYGRDHLIIKSESPCLGTSFGMSGPDTEVVRGWLRNYGHRVDVRSLPAVTCSQFFSDHSKVLTLRA